MQNDKITLKDLSIFSSDGSADVFSLLDYTTTQAGNGMLRGHIQAAPDSFELLQKTQDAIRFWSINQELWPSVISNGTLVMLEKFFEAVDDITARPSMISSMIGSYLQKILNRNQYFFIRFSLSHLSDFLKGCIQLKDILKQPNIPYLLKTELERIQDELAHCRLANDIIGIHKNTSYAELTRLSHDARREMKNSIYRLINHYARLDAWQAMGKASRNNNWIFPELLPAGPICFEAKALYHPLLQNPVAYNIDLSNSRNFLLLTGANMSGKSTFMRSIGVAALLAHMGVGVPAGELKISFLHGIITNMQVEDNILLGESYFFAEVQRMKLIARKLQTGKAHLVLMDELFKGTNVHDANECTMAVVEGLLNRPDHLMVLSTHLFEVARHFNSRKEVLFAYFVTRMMEDGSYTFTYQLQEGISNDRIGYRILQKEGVLELLGKK
jgi:DNA mismatch repair protein MutS